MGKKNQPDYQQLAMTQGELSQEALRDQNYANRPDQYTPYGAASWNPYAYTDPATGQETTRWAQTTALTPELQDIYNKQLAIQGGRSDIAGMLTGRMGASFGTPMDWRGMSPMGAVPKAQLTIAEPGIGNPYNTRQAAENAVYNQAMSRLAPQQDSQRKALENKMRNQGLSEQDASWQSQIQGQGNQFNDANNQAMWSANQAGLQESNQMYNQLLSNNQNTFNQSLSANAQNFGQVMDRSSYANQIRQQQIAETMQQRGFELNEINALLSGGQVGLPQMPTFSQSEQATPPDMLGAGIAQANAQAAQNPTNGILGAGATLGAAAITASDRRLKYNIKRIGTNKGYPWYSYNLKYDGSAHEGVMADEIPEKYTVDFGGLKAVNYGALLGE
jgi:DNA-binding transcriptional MerR regulator